MVSRHLQYDVTRTSDVIGHVTIRLGIWRLHI